MGVGRGHQGHLRIEGKIGECRIDLRVVGLAGVGQLNRHPVTPKESHQPVKFTLSCRKAGTRHSPRMVIGADAGHANSGQGAAHCPLAASREDNKMPIPRCGKRLKRVVGETLLSGGQMRHANRARQAAISLCTPGEHHEVGTAGIRTRRGSVKHGSTTRPVGRSKAQF